MNTPARVYDTLAKLAMCRTHVMGGRVFKCEDCDETTTLYNSCGDRHCRAPTGMDAELVDVVERSEWTSTRKLPS